MLVVLAAGLPARSHGAAASGQAAMRSEKKVCKTVKKHGKKHRVCTKAKPATPTPTPTPDVTTANPLSVSATLDTSRAVTQTITSGGGTLTATGADGSTYTLTLPAGALSDTTAITVTPIQSLQPLPPGATFAGGVDLAPDGLLLVKPGTLGMKLARSPAVQNQVGTSYSAGGKDFHLTPLTTDATTITFPIIHFSGRPMMDGRPAVFNYMYQHPPSSIPARYEQLMAGDVSLLRSGTITLAEYADRAVEIYRRLYNEVALKDAQAGLTDDTALALAFADWLYLARSLGIYNLEDRLATELQHLFDLVRQGTLNSIDRAGQRCSAAPRILIYDDLVGWTIDRADYVPLFRVFRQGEVFLGIPFSDSHVQHAIALCTPRGFKFEGLRYRVEVPDLVYPLSWWQFEVSGHICGNNPAEPNWTLTVHTTYNDSLFSKSAGDKTFVANRWMPAGTSAEGFPDTAGDGSINTSQSGNTKAIATLGKGPPPVIQLSVAWEGGPPGFLQSRIILQQADAQVAEDLTCPIPASSP